MEIRDLKPERLWGYFADLCELPRASYYEEKAVAFIFDFAKKYRLETYKDKKGNILVKKSGSPGYKDIKPVALQAHLDMVQQKKVTSNFDFSNQPLELMINGDWVRANETTLGADNGIGVAAILAVLASTSLVHPPIEALFTLEEEVGATGAIGLSRNLLKSEILLNLDSENIQHLTIGCAGSLDVESSGSYEAEATISNWKGLRISVKGLKGGIPVLILSKVVGMPS